MIDVSQGVQNQSVFVDLMSIQWASQDVIWIIHAARLTLWSQLCAVKSYSPQRFIATPALDQAQLGRRSHCPGDQVETCQLAISNY